jgi:hypothetical protein
MEVGTTIQVDIDERHDGYLKAECNGNRFSISGEGSVGDTKKVRVVKQEGIPSLQSPMARRSLSELTRLLINRLFGPTPRMAQYSS